MNEKLLEQRRKSKAKKPKFVRQDCHKQAKLRKCWRRPKGIQSKMRLGKKGYRKCVDAGYGSPAEVKGLSREGLVIVPVKSINDISLVKDGCGAMISGKVGQKKRMAIAKKCLDLGIKVLNIKDIDAYLKSASEKIKKKKEEKEQAKKEKEKKKAEKEKKAKEKKEEGLAEKLTDEEKKDKEKKEREKILTKKES